MKNILSAVAVTALIASSGAAFAQAGTSTPGNSGIRDRDSGKMITEKGMMVKVYDKAGHVYYEGAPKRMMRNKQGVGVWFPKMNDGTLDQYLEDAPEHTERSNN